MGSGRAFLPPRLPRGFWERSDVREALRDRDFGLLFRLVARHGGASQTQIAAAVGLTQGQVSIIMRGARRVTAIEVAERALDGLNASDPARVIFGLAPRVRTEVNVEDRHLADDVERRAVLRSGIAAVAQALTDHRSRTVGERRTTPSSTTELAMIVSRAKRHRQASRYSTALALLPRLLGAVRSACEAGDGDRLLRTHQLAADAYQATGSVLLKLGDVGLAAIAADRSARSATASGDPVMLAASARLITHMLMGSGHAEPAAELATRAAQRLSADISQPDGRALSVYGALLLRGAVAAAASNDRDNARRLLDEAEDAARRLGREDNAQWTAFGPTNVAQHRVHVAMVLGDAGTAVHLARQVDVNRIALLERRAALFLDTAMALAHWGKYEESYRALCDADRIAPEEVRTRGVARQLVAELVVRAPGRIRQSVQNFAEEIGAWP
jgi:tetratricopeptide (TPR) repeat protein